MTTLTAIQPISRSSVYPPERLNPAAGDATVGASVELTAPVDSFQAQSQKNEPTAQQKLAQTQRDALALFSQNPTSEKLIEAARQLSVKVYDGNTEPWVDALCQQRGVEGFVYTPHTLRYPKQDSGPSEIVAALTAQKPSNQQFDTESDKLASEGKQGLFVKKGVSRDVLMHELFHVLQERNGLPFGLNVEADSSADAINNYLNRVESGVIAKRVGLWALIGLNRMIGPAKPPVSPVALALYNQMQREAETDKFLMTYGEQLGLSPLQKLKHAAHYGSETLFKLHLSQLLDKDENLIARLEKQAQ